MTESELVKMFEMVTGKQVQVMQMTKEFMANIFDQITSPEVRIYMKSAEICADLTRNMKFEAQIKLCDDVLTVTGHPGTHMVEWTKDIYKKSLSN